MYITHQFCVEIYEPIIISEKARTTSK